MTWPSLDGLRVARRVETLLAGAQRLLDGADLALVVDLHDEQPGLRRADLRELVQGRWGPVVRNHDLVDQGRVGSAGANRRELGVEMLD